MPGGDRTGPMGMGPMTGRGAGWCAGGRGRGGWFGRGWGRGGGRGWGLGRMPGGENERDFLRSEVEALQKELEAVTKRLKDIESQPENKS